MLERARRGEGLASRELERLLAIDSRAEAEAVFAAARAVRDEYFGRRIFLYGFVYFSTYCRNWCTFCYYRRDNTESPRYRKSVEEVVAISHDLAASGVHLLDLTMGEDPLFHDTPDFGALVDLVATVKREVGLPVMVSPGVVPDDVLAELAGVGAEWYACYQETHTRDLYARLRVRQDYGERAAARS
ncbi:MAG TPA: radical SAM protein, partial [Thermoleophilia bacterium]|nr:radical SAM protein [Thermoleophilia bacterium]